MTEAELLAAFNVQPFDMQKVLLGLKAAGITFKRNYGEDMILHEVIWELEDLTKHNEKCGTRGILSQGFCTLYRVKEKHWDLRMPRYSFCYGRIGNTTTLDFDLTETPAPCSTHS